MNHSDDELRQATALFRYGVIADLVHLPVGTPGLIARMRDKAAQTYAIPGTTRTRVAANTIRDWIKLYRDGGFEALYPKPRADRGQPRRLPSEVASRLIALKVANPTWSVRTVIRAARDAGIGYPLAPPPCTGCSTARACSIPGPPTAPTAVASPSATPASCG